MTVRHSQFSGPGTAPTVSVPRSRAKPTPEGEVKEKKENKKPKGELGLRIEEVRERCGFLNREMAEYLSELLGTPIPQPTLLTWVRGSKPRRARFEEHDIMNALNKLEKEYGSEDGSTWTSAKVVKDTVLGWLKEMSHRQVAIASGEFVQTISLWERGKHKVMTRKWRIIVDRVNKVLAVLRASGATKAGDSTSKKEA